MTKQRRIHDRHALKPQDWKGRDGRTIFFFLLLQRVPGVRKWRHAKFGGVHFGTIY